MPDVRTRGELPSTLGKFMENRDPDSGQFTATTEEAYGLESVEQAMGYTQNQPTAPDIADDRSEEAQLQDALGGNQITTDDEGRPVYDDQPVMEINELSTVPAALVDRETREKLPEHITLKPEEAGEQLATYEQNLNSYVEGADLLNLVEVVDQARAQLSPEDMKDMGLDPAEVAKNAKQPEDESKQPNEFERAKYEGDAAIAAAHDEVGRALENPIIADALKERFAAAETARAQYAQHIDHAVRVAELSFLAQFPEFRGVTDQNHLASIASSIQQQNPARWQAIQNTTAQALQVLSAQQQQQQYQAAQDRQQYAAYAEAENDKFEKATNFSALHHAEQRAITDEILAMAEESGISKQEMARLSQTDRTMRSAFAQRTLMEAAQYRLMQKTARAVPTRSVPSVTKPGNASPRASKAQTTEAQLMARLNASGSEEAGWALLQSRINRRG
jgi:hypothetical protein